MADPRDIIACTGCGKPEHIDLLDGAPPTPKAQDFTDLLCILCYGTGVPWDNADGARVLLQWAPASDAAFALSVRPDLALRYSGWRDMEKAHG